MPHLPPPTPPRLGHGKLPAVLLASAAALFVILASPARAQPSSVNDYPTLARAEYVFACMATNGQTRDAMARCSCSIDTIAEILSWDDYVAAETVLRMRIGGGERAALFRGNPTNNAIVAELRRAQAEAEILCF